MDPILKNDVLIAKYNLEGKYNALIAHCKNAMPLKKLIEILNKLIKKDEPNTDEVNFLIEVINISFLTSSVQVNSFVQRQLINNPEIVQEHLEEQNWFISALKEIFSCMGTGVAIIPIESLNSPYIFRTLELKDGNEPRFLGNSHRDFDDDNNPGGVF